MEEILFWLVVAVLTALIVLPPYGDEGPLTAALTAWARRKPA